MQHYLGNSKKFSLLLESEKSFLGEHYAYGKSNRAGLFSSEPYGDFLISSDMEWRVFIFGLMAGVSHDKIFQHARSAQYLSCFHYQLAFNPDKIFTFDFCGENKELKGKITSSGMMVDAWLKYFFLSVLFRDGVAISNFVKFDSEDVRYPQKFDVEMLNFVKGVFGSDIDLKACLQRLMTYSGDDYVDATRRPHIGLKYLPFLQCLISVLVEDKEKYEKDMEKALNDFVEFGKKIDLPHEDGIFSMLLMGVAALAYDRNGWETQSSPYLIDFLVKGDF